MHSTPDQLKAADYIKDGLGYMAIAVLLADISALSADKDFDKERKG